MEINGIAHRQYDEELLRKGVIYGLKYFGNIELLCSMKGIGYEERCRLIRLCIAHMCQTVNGMINDTSDEFKKLVSERKVTSDSELTRNPNDVLMTISVDFIKILEKKSRDVLSMHPMEAVSFASTGIADYGSCIAYVAKDSLRGRSCYVFQSPNSPASLVMATIGQAFNLKYRDTVGASRHLSDSSSVGTSMKSLSRRTSRGSRSNEEFDPFDEQDAKNDKTQTANGKRNEVKQSTFEGPSKTDITENLINQNWYHGLISRNQAETLLEMEGDFLVRKSTNIVNQYVLSGKYNGKCKHLLLVDPQGGVRTKGISFRTISDLINYHRRQKISIVSPDSKILLLRPVIRTNNDLCTV